MKSFTRGRATAVACAAALAAGCGADERTDRPAASLPQDSEPVKLDPAEFSTRIDNPYWPMMPGTRWVYRETSPGRPPQRVVVTVTNRTKRVAAGVLARVVHDRVTRAGRIVEDTRDWYAQDADGNVWYLGEATTEYENGRPTSTHGSWEAGADGAQAGVIMPANPRVGMTYRQEYRAGEAEDRGRVLALGERVRVPAGRFEGALRTRDWNPLDPGAVENKLYVRGTGPVLAVDVSGSRGREELVRVTRPR